MPIDFWGFFTEATKILIEPLASKLISKKTKSYGKLPARLDRYRLGSIRILGLEVYLRPNQGIPYQP